MNNIIDSSMWLEYFLGGKCPAACKKMIENPSNLVVPAITIFEVFRRFLHQYDETSALNVTGRMQEGRVIEMDYYLSILAAKKATDLGLGMADSYIYATAELYNAELWTLDSDFKDLPNVKYFAKT